MSIDDKIRLASGMEVLKYDVGTEDNGKMLSVSAGKVVLMTPDDAGVVAKTGAQTIAGVKTFSSSPVVPVTPTTATQAASKQYVDSVAMGLDWQNSVLDFANAPTGSETGGERYVVGTGSGAFVGHDGDIAVYDGDAEVWNFTTPEKGFALWDEDSEHTYVFNGTAWIDIGASMSLAGHSVTELDPAGETDRNKYLKTNPTTGAIEYATIQDADIPESIARDTELHDALTLAEGQENGLVLDGQELSLNTATTETAGAMSASDKSKLDGIEAGADVTNATNVAAAGAVMTSGDQEISGNKMFSGVTTLAAGSGIIVNDTADGTIGARRLCEIDPSGNLVEAQAESISVVGINTENTTKSASETIKLGVSGVFTCVADRAIEGGTLLKAYKGGRVGRALTKDLQWKVMAQTGTGGSFDNDQLSGNEAIRIISDSLDDINISVTVYGTRTGQGDAVFSETIILYDNGDFPEGFTSIYTDWSKLLAIKPLSTPAGNLISTDAADNVIANHVVAGYGYFEIPNGGVRLFNSYPALSDNDARTSTKTIGIIGKDINDNDLMTSKTGTGSTELVNFLLDSKMNFATCLLIGDLEVTLGAKLYAGSADSTSAMTDGPELIIGRAGPNGAAARDDELVVII